MKTTFLTILLLFSGSAALANPCGPEVDGAPHENGGGFEGFSALMSETAPVDPAGLQLAVLQLLDRPFISFPTDDDSREEFSALMSETAPVDPAGLQLLDRQSEGFEGFEDISALIAKTPFMTPPIFEQLDSPAAALANPCGPEADDLSLSANPFGFEDSYP